MESQRSSFPYRPLPTGGAWIRLLRLLPGQFDDPIYCELEHGDHDQGHLSYTALSYVWGDANTTKPIGLRYYHHSQASGELSDSAEIALENGPRTLRHASSSPTATSFDDKAGDDALLARAPSSGAEKSRGIPSSGDEQEFQQVQITTNLEVALRYVREESITMIIWVDAVCINQRDSAERSSQVQMMGRVYSQASAVRIWVGPALPDEDFPSETTESLPVKLAAASSYVTLVASTAALEDYGYLYNTPDQLPAPLSDCARTGLYFITSRQWWSRLWVLQEAHLGPSTRELQCGKTKMGFWPCLRSIELAAVRPSQDIEFNRLQYDLKMSDIVTCLAHVRFRHFLQERRPAEASPARQLLGLMEITAGKFRSSDPRDRIFALMGSLPFRLPLGLQPDYQKPASEIFISLSRYLLDGSGSLYLLSFAGGLPSPSWASDFSNVPRGREVVQLGDLVGQRISTNTHHVEVTAAHLGTVLSAHEFGPKSRLAIGPSNARDHIAKIKAALAEHLDLDKRPKDNPRTPRWSSYLRLRRNKPNEPRDSQAGALSRNLDRLIYDDIVNTNLKCKVRYDVLLNFLENGQLDLQRDGSRSDLRVPMAGEDIGKEGIEAVHKVVCTWASFHRVVVIDSDLGVHQAYTMQVRAGDLIVAIPTCQYALLLRPAAEDPTKRFRIVGSLFRAGFSGGTAAEMRQVILNSKQMEIELV